MNVTEAFQAWVDYRRKMADLKMVAGSTYINQTAIAHQLGSALGFHALAGLRKSHIELWMGERLRTCSPLTVRGELNVLRQVLRWCQDEGHLVTLPRLPKLSVPSVESALPSDEAFAWVLAHVPPQHAAALEFMMLTGLSPHELERVQVRDATRFQGTYPDQLGIGMRPDFAVKQPSRRRWVPLNGRARVLWFEATAGAISDVLHPFPKVEAMQKAIRRAVDAAPKLGSHPRAIPPASVAHVTPKLMRKWFASKVAGEQPEHVLQRLMGHAPGSPITRKHYVRSTDDQQAKAVADVGLPG